MSEIILVAVTRAYHFEAAHYLPLVRDGHKCKNMHGHNYKIEVSVCHYDRTFVNKNEDRAIIGLGDNGFVIDFWDLDTLVQPLIDMVDHKVLNDVDGLSNPTAENIALWFLNQLKQHDVTAVRCWEVDEASAVATFMPQP